MNIGIADVIRTKSVEEWCRIVDSYTKHATRMAMCANQTGW